MIGGAIRVPKVKEFIEKRLDDVPAKFTLIGSHMNGDESMAMGAAYVAANFTSAYKVEKVHLYQSIPESVHLSVHEEGCDSDKENCFHKEMTLFEKGRNNFGSKKTVSISHHFGNMEITLRTDNEILITGSAKLLPNLPQAQITASSDKKISLVFKYDKNGILSIHRAEAILVDSEGKE